MPSRAEVIEGYRKHLNQGVALLAELTETHAEERSEGAYVWDEQGERYLELGGYGVFILGHGHPKVVAAVRDQLERHALTSRALLSPVLARAAASLAEVAPPGLDYVYLATSGAEAAELALKLGRLNGRRRIVSMEGGFHGKTMGALSVTGREMYRAPFEPLLPDVDLVPFGDADALEAALADGEPATVILEPLEAEAGVLIPPDGYLRDVQRLSREHGAFLVLDEIQSGLGRLGEWWDCDREGVVPDVLLCGKGLSGGVMPVAAVIASEEAFNLVNRDPMLHSSTFAGSPLAAGAVPAALDAIRDEDVIPRARDLGERLLDLVSGLAAEHLPGVVKEVRGRGLLIGIEFHDPSAAAELVVELQLRKVILSHSMHAHETVRMTPPVGLTDEDLDWLQTAFVGAAEQVARTYAGMAGSRS